MADNPSSAPDVGARLHAQNITGGGGATQGKTKTDDYVNAENAIGEHAKASADKAGEALGLTVPVVGKMISLMFSGNSAAAGLESEGIQNKMIMPTGGGVLPDSQGGVLARLWALLGKGRDITDLTAMVGGDAGGGGAAAGAGGGGDFSSLPDFSVASAQFSSNASDMVDYGSGRFDRLGDIPSPLPVDAPVISTPSRGGEGAALA